MTLLVTGATGFVGAAVVRALLAQGQAVRVLVRPESDPSNLHGLEVETVHGDLLDPASFAPAVAGCRGVYHVAADYRLWVPDPAPMYRANVDATRELMRAALDAGVERVVYTSSVATLGHHADGRPADESTPSALSQMIGHYKRSKYLAEQVVQEMVQQEGLPAVIVNPSTPIGPGDIKPTPTGRMVLDAARGKMAAYVETGLNVAHVDDVAAGHLLAYANGQVGERYILGGEDLSLKQILTIVAHACGGKPPRVRLPVGLIVPVALLVEGWTRLTHGKDPLVTMDGLRMAKKTMYFSWQKAANELGYQPRPACEAIEDAVHWFHQQGLCDVAATGQKK